MKILWNKKLTGAVLAALAVKDKKAVCSDKEHTAFYLRA